MDKLKPCPFCGGRAKLHTRQIRYVGETYTGERIIRTGAQVICNRCKARGSLYTGNVKRAYTKAEDATYKWITSEAVNAWNRRVNNG